MNYDFPGCILRVCFLKCKVQVSKHIYEVERERLDLEVELKVKIELELELDVFLGP